MCSSARSAERFRQHFYSRVSAGEIDPAAVREIAERARQEDCAGWGFRNAAPSPGDPTSFLLDEPGRIASAHLIAREELVPAGLAFAPILLECFGPTLQWERPVEDGHRVAAGSPLARVSGPIGLLFTVERSLLNFLQMLSGIATATRRLIDCMGATPTKLLDTRKTPPGYRALAKYAVSSGGGWNHRLGLHDRIMLKDNHLAAGQLRDAGDFRKIAAKARATRPDLPLQIEIDRIDQLDAALAAEPDAVLFDNFTPDELRTAVSRANGRCLTEASGGITEATLPALARLGLDFISTGATVHRARWVDIGMDLGDPHPRP